MHSIRCRCGKIVCQVENLPAPPKVEEFSRKEDEAGPAAVILCRHCKRYVILRFPVLASVQVTSDLPELAGHTTSYHESP